MKTRTEIKPIVENVWYACEYCGKESLRSDKIRECEEKCKKKAECDHEFKYEACTYYDESNIELARSCRKCDKYEDKIIDADDIPSDIVYSLWVLEEGI